MKDQHKAGWEDEFRKECAKTHLVDEEYQHLKSFIAKEKQKSYEQGRNDERAKCRQIFVDEVEWSEWAISPEEAGKVFDCAVLERNGESDGMYTADGGGDYSLGR